MHSHANRKVKYNELILPFDFYLLTIQWYFITVIVKQSFFFCENS